MNFMLKVGDKAVYPGHGVGKITSIEDKSILGSKLTFYSMEIIESGTKIMIPKNRMESIGIRPIVSKQEAEKVMGIISDKNLKETQTNYVGKNWQKRHQSYMDKIKTGSIYEIAKVIRDLNNIKEEKELSYGEKKMMNKAKNILYSELSLTMDKKELEILSNPSN
ncbi:MAG: CarD family transcriptional regulator [Bdellovibrionaceae bacterium]|nr:CarD family transcriptional regulator [Pseudobdellovibrionaceae bacterium]